MTQNRLLPSEVGLINVKFDTALRLNPCRFFLDQYSYLPPTDPDKKIFSKFDDDPSQYRVGVKVVARLISKSLHLRLTSHIRHLSALVDASWEHLVIQEEHLLSRTSDSNRLDFDHLATMSKRKIQRVPGSIESLYCSMWEWDAIIETTTKHRYSKTIAEIDKNEPLDMKFFSTPSFVFIEHSGIKYLLNHDQILMVQNKVHELFNVFLIGWLFCSHEIWTPSFFRDQERLIEFMLEKIVELDNDAYTVFKSFDGICSGIILSKESFFDNSTPLADIFSELTRDHLLSRSETMRLTRLFDRPPHEAMELSAMSKLCGHPDINTTLGIDKLRSRTFQDNPVSHQDVSLLLCNMKSNFILDFLTKHGRWPLVELEPGINPTLTYCRFHNLWITDKRLPTFLGPVSLQDFSSIKLSKVMDFDYIESQFDFLKDTALAQMRSIILNPTLLKTVDRRLQRTLVYFLVKEDPASEVMKYFDRIRNNDPLALEYLVIKLTQKERELKSEGRFFGASPYEERARRCILEQNVSKLMERHNTNQAMTLTELQKLKKMYTLARLGFLSPSITPVFMSVDVEAWNNNFRRAVCEPVGREFFNHLFGTTEFSNVMNTFEHSLISASDNVLDYAWNGQYGGIEGLFQKFWTWVYESVASRVARMTQYDHFLMVNGDDLRVIFLIPNSELSDPDFKTRLDTIAKSFEHNFQKFGFKFKIQETYFSTTHFGFGKLYMYDSVFTSNTLKKGAKIHGLANLMGDYPLEYLKGVMSEGQATMGVSVNHRLIYLATTLRFQIYLLKFYPDYSKLALKQKLTILFWPSNFGGLPVLPYLRCLYKGDSDVETIWISLYLFIYANNPEFGRDLIQIIFKHIIMATSYKGLASNPYSIPNNTPPEGLTLIRSFIRRQIDKHCQNRQFADILRQTSNSKTELYLNGLFSCTPLVPKALSVIYSTSAAGILDEFLATFDSSKSIASLITKRFKRISSLRLLRRAKAFDMKKIDFVMKEISKISQPSPASEVIFNDISCSTKCMDALRQWCYGKPLIGITYPCVAEQVSVLDYTNMTNLSHSDYYTFWLSEIDSGVNINYSRGPHMMNLGNHTHLKLLTPDLELKTTSPGLKRVTKLLKVHSMLHQLGPECTEFVKENLRNLTGLDPNMILDIAYKHISGSISHRVPSNHWSPLVGPNELSNRSTYLYSTTSTDRASHLRSGDYTLNYGLIRSHVNLLILYASEFHSYTSEKINKATYYVRVNPCETCTFEVTDQPVAWAQETPHLNFHLAGNKYVCMSTSEIHLLQEKIESMKERHSYLESQRVKCTDSQMLHYSRILMAKNILEQAHERVQQHRHSNDLPSFGEEDLNLLLSVPTIELSSLTDVKKTPSEYLLKAMSEYFLGWMFDHLPENILNKDIQVILNLKPENLPLKQLSHMIYECGYWPVLQQKLKETYPFCPSSGVDSAIIQVFLCRYLYDHLENLNPGKMEYILDVPVTKYPDDDDLIAHVNSTIKVKSSSLIYSWLHHDGLELQQSLMERRFNEFKADLHDLAHFKRFQYSPSAKSPLSLFIFNPDSPDPAILTLVLRLCNIDRLTIDNLFQLLLQHEGPETSHTRTSLLKFQVNLLFMPADLTTRTVRMAENVEFTSYYGTHQDFLPVKQIRVPLTGITKTVKLRYSLEPASFNFDLNQLRLNNITQSISKLQTASARFGSSSYFRSFGGLTGGTTINILLINDLKFPIVGTVIVINDLTGSWISASVYSNPDCRVTILSHNYLTDGAHTDFKEYDFLMLQTAARVNRSYCHTGSADIFNQSQRELFLREIDDISTVILVMNDVLINHVPVEAICRTLKELLTRSTKDSHMLIAFQASIKPEKIAILLTHLMSNYQSVEIASSGLLSDRPLTLLIKVSVPYTTADIPIIDRDGPLAIEELIRPRELGTESTTVESDRFYQIHSRLMNKLPLSSPIRHLQTLQSLTAKFSSLTLNPTWILFKEHFYEILESERSRLLKYETDLPVRVSDHRMLVEIEIFIALLDGSLEVENEERVGDWINNTLIDHVQEIYNKEPDQIWVSKTLLKRVIPSMIQCLGWALMKYYSHPSN